MAVLEWTHNVSFDETCVCLSADLQSLVVDCVIGDQLPASSSSVMSKKLNNATLGLRFMQNAQRAKNPSEVIPVQASIPDDAEWHVPQNVRDTWTSADAAAPNSNS